MSRPLVDIHKPIKNIPIGIMFLNKTLYVDPKKINLHSRPEFYSLHNSKICQVLDGDWDLNFVSHDEEDFYLSLKMFEKTKSWKETPHYKRIIKEIKSGKIKWGCNNTNQFECYLDNIVKIFNSIKKDGYCDINPNDRVEVNVGRNGQYFLNNGRHRLAMAKLLGIKKIPININTIHSSLVPPSSLDRDYALFNRRKNIMEKYVNIDWSVFSNKTVLDIGPAYGIWSVLSHHHKGLVEAIDVDDEYMRIFKKITGFFRYNIPISKKNVLEMSTDKKYDIVFFMAVWHHIPRQQDCYKALDTIFSITKERLILEGPITNSKSQFKKQQKGPAEHHSFYWIPSFEEIKSEIEKRGGKILKTSFGENKKRVFMEIEVAK